LAFLIVSYSYSYICCKTKFCTENELKEVKKSNRLNNVLSKTVDYSDYSSLLQKLLKFFWQIKIKKRKG